MSAPCSSGSRSVLCHPLARGDFPPLLHAPGVGLSQTSGLVLNKLWEKGIAGEVTGAWWCAPRARAQQWGERWECGRRKAGLLREDSRNPPNSPPSPNPVETGCLFGEIGKGGAKNGKERRRGVIRPKCPADSWSQVTGDRWAMEGEPGAACKPCTPSAGLPDHFCTLWSDVMGMLVS